MYKSLNEYEIRLDATDRVIVGKMASSRFLESF